MGFNVVLVRVPAMDVGCSGAGDGVGLEASVAPAADVCSAAADLDCWRYDPGAKEVLAGPDGCGRGPAAAVCLGGILAEDLEGEAEKVSLVRPSLGLSSACPGNE